MSLRAPGIATMWIRERARVLRAAARSAEKAYSAGHMAEACRLAAAAYRAGADALEAEADTIDHGDRNLAKPPPFAGNPNEPLVGGLEPGSVTLTGYRLYRDGRWFTLRCPAKPNWYGRVSHFATCPNAAKHRKKRTKRK